VTLEVRMSSEAFGRGQGHYEPYEEGATVADMLAAGAAYAKEYHYRDDSIVYEPWKDWDRLLKNKGTPFTSIKIVQVHGGAVTKLAYDNPPGVDKVPGYYGDERYEIDVKSMPAATELQDIFDFAELAHQLGPTWCKDCSGPFHLDGKKITTRRNA